MSSPSTAFLPELPAGARVLVIRLRSLGDALPVTPALRALKRWRPDLRLSVLLYARFASILAGNPDLEEVIELAPAGGAPRPPPPRPQPLPLSLCLHGVGRPAPGLRARPAPCRRKPDRPVLRRRPAARGDSAAANLPAAGGPGGSRAEAGSARRAPGDALRPPAPGRELLHQGVAV